jgi:aspartate-semialdehyde dehydrogenase
MTKYNIAVVGATGVVGWELLQILKERNFPVGNVHALASRQSIGKEVSFGETEILKIESLDSFDFSSVDIVFSAAGSGVSKNFVPEALKKGCYVIDKTSAYREDEKVPLIVPEVNIDVLKDHKLISNPNCIAIPLTIVLDKLRKFAPIKRVVISTYQSVSGAGRKAMDELFNQTKSMMMYQDPQPNIFPKRISFNIIPKIGELDEENNSDEETKIINETKKILGENIHVSATCVRVPVFIGHSVSVNVEFSQDFSIDEIVDSFEDDDLINYYAQNFITPIEIVKSDEIAISRLRRDKSVPFGLNLWMVADNIRKGAALNAVQIAEHLVKE